MPHWIAPQLAQLVDAAPEGDERLHEIKFDGYRVHARLDRGGVALLTRTGLNWTHKYPAIAEGATALDARQAYIDGELCGTFPNGITLVQQDLTTDLSRIADMLLKPDTADR